MRRIISCIRMVIWCIRSRYHEMMHEGVMEYMSYEVMWEHNEMILQSEFVSLYAVMVYLNGLEFDYKSTTNTFTLSLR